MKVRYIISKESQTDWFSPVFRAEKATNLSLMDSNKGNFFNWNSKVKDQPFSSLKHIFWE